jgi:hypothetical protein
VPHFVRWLLRCCPLSDFVIACRHATINALVAGRFRDKLFSTTSTAATTATATTVVELTVVHCQRKRHEHVYKSRQLGLI